ncbi:MULTISPECIES: hypothetical protein [Gordonia]|uniref:Uncharacterized protein n=1 Tax=Gordonia sihwensis NBRC 108236 TaxID=1223544 RepID=L7LNT5_9ACTN|nr:MULTISPECIES: hypothetical protein [Gordonia]AUH70562.1 hypothetical protein CXX93_19285 [Gordonia sp. YC-JH1]WFN95177.1 hypothetical protein P5P27_20645 [Gordonia sihwensis]GAC62386.1 hypothetical protein GSI01S_33_00720 [Gordonia sihwensis NBRC 108236]
MILRATQLPQIRKQMVAALRADATKARSLDPAIWGSGHDLPARLWDAEADGLETGSLWWVSPDMTTLALDTALSGRRLPEWEFPSEHRTGLVVFDGGLSMQLPHSDRTVDAISWTRFAEAPQHTALMGDLRVSGWTKAAVRAGGRAGLEKLLMPEPADTTDLESLAHMTISIGEALMSPEIVLWRILIATMLLSQEPKVAGTRPANLATDGHPRETRNRPIPEVTVIDLRTVRDWSVGPDGTAASAGDRHYSCRWIVRDHWKTYHVGPGRSRKEERWIAPYVAGPEGAPLIRKERVWVWRR